MFVHMVYWNETVCRKGKHCTILNQGMSFVVCHLSDATLCVLKLHSLVCLAGQKLGVRLFVIQHMIKNNIELKTEKYLVCQFSCPSLSSASSDSSHCTTSPAYLHTRNNPLSAAARALEQCQQGIVLCLEQWCNVRSLAPGPVPRHAEGC